MKDFSYDLELNVGYITVLEVEETSVLETVWVAPCYMVDRLEATNEVVGVETLDLAAEIPDSLQTHGVSLDVIQMMRAIQQLISSMPTDT